MKPSMTIINIEPGKSNRTKEQTPHNHYKACLFDMDGLIIDSESIYTEVSSKILREHFGIEEGMTWELKSKIQGVPGPQQSQIIIESYGITDRTTADEFYKLSSELQTEYWPDVQLLPGAEKLIKYLHNKGIPICVCTSSHSSKFKLKTSHLQELFKLFDGNVITGDNEAIAGKGKPLPFIWWMGLDTINQKLRQQRKDGIKAQDCLIFEDAKPGIISGKRAGGYVIWVPDKHNLEVIGDEEISLLVGDRNEYGIVLDSLEDFDPAEFGL